MSTYDKKSDNQFYKDIAKGYDSNSYFDEYIININYVNNDSFDENKEYDTVNVEESSDKNENRIYKIINVSCEQEFTDNKKLNRLLGSIIEELNENLTKYNYPKDWQMFYLYKEVIQKLTSINNKFNYFRGQSNDYGLCPGILRNGTSKEYRQEFEYIYRKLDYMFPDFIHYYPLKEENIEKREEQLSILQHYELKTSLLDITSNPFIAMVFIFSKTFEKYKEPVLYFFRVKDHGVDKDILFSEVRKNNNNERINAQKGAFFNFDKVKFIGERKVPCVKLVLKHDDYEFLKRINDIKEKVKELIKTNDYKNRSFKNLETLLDNLDKKMDDDSYKVSCINRIQSEIKQKLAEYFYCEEDLFPDFMKQLKYISNKYDLDSKDDGVSLNELLNE